ncbi:hypothetical protein LGQ03_07120 [Loktanella sp. TSTF-M6]|uniref:Uncharacterized protein n=1 Tax=Loktanella gaetbuli TaxID=2881335 RepID=A0ABS8BU15_9RHOB|nr:hypothetical protein [Loktanella gaetbuli]MCB5199006.1 hypothetical protein [Loktanella gaetbuli]
MIDGELTEGGRSRQYEDGRRRGLKEAITFLHARAIEMNDPRATDILNSAADALGGRLASSRRDDVSSD